MGTYLVTEVEQVAAGVLKGHMGQVIKIYIGADHTLSQIESQESQSGCGVGEGHINELI